MPEVVLALPTGSDAAAVSAACKAAFLPILAEAGIVRVVIAYDGEGDEGQIHEIMGYGADGSVIALPAVDCARHALGYDGSIRSDNGLLVDALDSFGYEALAAHWTGWENGSGACGEIEIIVETGAVTLTHNSRFVDYDTSVLEL